MRATLAARGAWACVKPMPNRKHIPAFSPFLYRYRNLVERFFNKLKHFRAVATCYDKRDDKLLAPVQLASLRIRPRHKRSKKRRVGKEVVSTCRYRWATY